MPKYAAKPNPGPVEQQILATPHKRHEIKVEGFVNQAVVPWEFKRDGNTITITEVSRDGQLLKVVVQAVDGVGQTIGVNNPLLFYNPPIKVWDGTVHVDAGKEVENFVEDYQKALEDMTSHIVTLFKSGKL